MYALVAETGFSEDATNKVLALLKKVVTMEPRPTVKDLPKSAQTLQNTAGRVLPNLSTLISTCACVILVLHTT